MTLKVSFSENEQYWKKASIIVILNKLQIWADENGFKFSTQKTPVIHFCNQRKIHPDPILKVNNCNIPVTKEIKFLGIIFDHKLSFIPHIKYLKTL